MDYKSYFDSQEKAFREVLYHLHGVLDHAADGVSVRMNWGQPFYYYRGEWFAYLAYVKKWRCVELGFPKGYLIKDPTGLLLTRNRTTVRSLDFLSTEDFTSREQAILELIQLALMLNE
jgi:hypothetical protein